MAFCFGLCCWIRLLKFVTAGKMVLSSSSSEEASTGENDVGQCDPSASVATEANAVPVAERKPLPAEDKSKELAEVWWPERVTIAVRSSVDFGEYKKKRIFTFAHLFSGQEDVLSRAVRRLAALDGMSVKTYSFDRDGPGKEDFLKEQPYADLLESCRNGELDAVHAGPPCGSFSMVRHRPGGPPAVRNLEHIYGLPTNSPEQQKEADQGSLLSIRTTNLLGEQIQSQRRRQVPEAATLENPPGSKSQVEGSMWALPETMEWMEHFECLSAWFNTCAFQRKERNRWLKPTKFAGRLKGLESLHRKCSCPRDFKHQALLGKRLTSAAARYPEDLALEYARLVVQCFRTTLNLEWWRHLEKYKRAELTQLQKNWVKSKEKHSPAALPDEHMNKTRSNKRAWCEEDFMQDQIPGDKIESKKARREFQNQYFVGGMRNPAISVRRLGIVKEAGQDILRLWNTFLRDNPVVLEAARAYGSDRCQLDERAAIDWTLKLGALLKVEPPSSVKLQGKFAFSSPLNAPFWKAWQKFSKDPDEHIHQWAVTGAPLGMSAEIPSSGGVSPPVEGESSQVQIAPELEVQLGMGNYKSMHEDEQGARQELDRLVDRGFAQYLSKDEARAHFDRATLSKLALITKVKESGAKKYRVIIDLLRSGGNDRSRVPERIILPRISDVVASLRELFAQNEGAEDPSQGEIELISADLSDAYMHFAVEQSELQNCLAPGLADNELVLFKAMSFGFRGAPLVMGRLAAAAMRLFQSMMPDGKGQIQCYMDDPLLMIRGPAHERQGLLAMVLYTARAFGLQLSYSKADRGSKLVWIGVSIEVDVPNKLIILSPPEKLVEEVTLRLGSWEGMVSLRSLKSTTGKLSWIAGIIPRSRWAVSILYAVIADHERDVASGAEARRAAMREDPRDKSGMVHVSRVALAREWLLKMLATQEIWRARKVPLVEEPPKWVVTTDASPLGVGAVLASLNPRTSEMTVIAAVKGKTSRNVASTLGIVHNDPAGQAALEAWMVLLAIRYWAFKLRSQKVLLKADSTVALAVSKKLASSSATLNWVGAELSLVLETLNMPELTAHHLAGKLNIQADHLSRPDKEGVPPGLEDTPIRVMNEAWMLETNLSPPGVRPELWGKSPGLLPVFDGL